MDFTSLQSSVRGGYASGQGNPLLSCIKFLKLFFIFIRSHVRALLLNAYNKNVDARKEIQHSALYGREKWQIRQGEKFDSHTLHWKHLCKCHQTRVIQIGLRKPPDTPFL